jgi:hypothetical protein
MALKYDVENDVKLPCCSCHQNVFDAGLHSYPFPASVVDERTYIFGEVIEEGWG